MISLIICSVKGTIDRKLSENIAETVGVPYEVICIDNSQNKYSIFEAYNHGATLAQYDLLCFMHEDILYHTKGWGAMVADKLSEPRTGVLGVAGAVFKSAAPSPWWVSDLVSYQHLLRINILQHFASGVKRQEVRGEGPAQSWEEVVVLDGVWLCCRRAYWEEHPFDFENYHGFHFYDLDFSLTAFAAGYKNYVSQDILLEHFSPGYMDKGWIKVSKVFHRKWKGVLPVRCVEMGVEQIRAVEADAEKNFANVLTYNRHRSPFLWLRYWIGGALREPFRKATWMALYYHGRSYIK